MNGRQTPHAVRGSGGDREIAAVSGFVLKRVRGSLGLTQVDLAERLSVDVSTVQGWESGRRPLTALRVADLTRLRNRLTLLGASPAIAGQLHEAVEADGILATSIEAGDRMLAPDRHPLAAAVHRRSLVRLITWPFTGLAPPPLQDLPAPQRRGPVADRPDLTSSECDRFFDHMLVSADSADASDSSVLHRQATYLLGFDGRPSSADWLNREHRRALRKYVADDVHAGITARTAAVALARRGDEDSVRGFIDTTLTNQSQSLANLTYWAYWIGEIPEACVDDAAIAAVGLQDWQGTRLLGHLAKHLEAPGDAELNIHSLWTLVLARPHLLEQYPALLARVETSVDAAMDNGFTGPARADLTNLHCAVQLAKR